MSRVACRIALISGAVIALTVTATAAQAATCPNARWNTALTKYFARAPTAAECNDVSQIGYLVVPGPAPAFAITDQALFNAVASYYRAHPEGAPQEPAPSPIPRTGGSTVPLAPAQPIYLFNGNAITQAQLNAARATYNGNQVTYIINNKTYNVIAAGGGNFTFSIALIPVGTRVIAAGGGNVIAAGGGNVIAAGGGNLLSTNGGNH